MNNKIKEPASAQPAAPDVPQQARDSVTPCALSGCTNPARPCGKFCSGAHRQKAYRKSPKHRAYLDLLIAARFERRRRHQAMKVAYKTFVPQTGLYTGPDNGLAPRRVPQDLTPYLKGDLGVAASDIQAAAQRRLEREKKSDLRLSVQGQAAEAPSRSSTLNANLR